MRAATSTFSSCGLRISIQTTHTWRGQLDELANLVRRWTGNNAGIAEVSEGELSRLRKDRPPVVEEVSEDAVDLAGEATRKLLRRL